MATQRKVTSPAEQKEKPFKLGAVSTPHHEPKALIRKLLNVGQVFFYVAVSLHVLRDQSKSTDFTTSGGQVVVERLQVDNGVPNNVHNEGIQSPLEIPKGIAIALPSVRVAEEENVERTIYGGKGDKVHLGGFTEYDGAGVSPAVWKYMVEYIGVKSLLDLGCGRGTSTSWFVLHGVDAICAEGSHDAVEHSMIPDKESRVTEHDFSRGPWWPNATVDAVWSVEFLEHVGRQFHKNYITTFRKAALIFVTHSFWGGWHHVEVHEPDWWINKFEMYGFRYSESLSEKVRDLAREERHKGIPGPGGKPLAAQHIGMSMKVFINPYVAALPQHAHLLAEPGCYDGKDENGGMIHRVCNTGKNKGKETPLPESYHPIKLTPEMDQKWMELLEKNVNFEHAP